jgi:hypothetical protein
MVFKDTNKDVLMKYATFALLAAVLFIAGFITGRYTMTAPPQAHNNTAASTSSGQGQDDLAAKEIAEGETISNLSAPTSPRLASEVDTKETQLAHQQRADSTMSQQGVVPDQHQNDHYAATNEQKALSAEEITKYPLAQQELSQWTQRYKTELKENMANTLGDEGAEFMFEQITKENAFLNDPIAEHSLEEDLSQRSNVEQAIRDYLVMNNTDPSIDILSINCIQGLCEATLTGNDSSSLMRNYMSLVNGAVAGITEGGRPTTYVMPDGGFWAYWLLRY